jgi:hypothetical protein
MPLWEYAILTRMSAGLDTKWYLNRTYQHSETDLPEEVTEPAFQAYNQRFDELHATKVYPVLPAILNLMGADGWELIDDMATGITGGEGLVFKRPMEGVRRTATRAAKAARPAGRNGAKSGAKKTATKRRR